MFYWILNQQIEAAYTKASAAYYKRTINSFRSTAKNFGMIADGIVKHLLSRPLPEEAVNYYTAQAYYCSYQSAAAYYFSYLEAENYKKAHLCRINATGYIKAALDILRQHMDDADDSPYNMLPNLNYWEYLLSMSTIFEEFPLACKLFDESDYVAALEIFSRLAASIKNVINGLKETAEDDDKVIDEIESAVVYYADMLLWQSVSLFQFFKKSKKSHYSKEFSNTQFMLKLAELYNAAYEVKSNDAENELWEYLGVRILEIEKITIKILKKFAGNISSIKEIYADDPVMLSLINILPAPRSPKNLTPAP